MVRQKPGTNEEDAQPQEDSSERVLKREGYTGFQQVEKQRSNQKFRK